MSSEWAVEAVKRLRKQQESERQQSGAMFEKRKLLREQGDRLWKEIGRHVVKLADDFNAEIKSKAISVLPGAPTELHVRLDVASAEKELLARFNAGSANDALHWTYDGGGTKAQEYQLFVNEYGAVSIGSGQNQNTKTPEVIAMEMLDGLLQE